MLAIAHNCLVDWLRRTRREVPIGQDLDQLVELSPAGGAAESKPFSPELVAAVARYISGLSSELRAVHELRFELLESQERAAETLGISRQTLRTLERKLITALRRHMITAGLARASLSVVQRRSGCPGERSQAFRFLSRGRSGQAPANLSEL